MDTKNQTLTNTKSKTKHPEQKVKKNFEKLGSQKYKMKNKHQTQKWKTQKILQQNQVELSSKKQGEK